MIFIIIILFVILLYCSVCVRLALSHPIHTLHYGTQDLYEYIKYHKWNNCTTADLICLTGLFGQGKTLSGVHLIVSKYRRYNNVRVYDFERRKWVTQKVLVISNVHLKHIPYEHMTSLSQIVSFCENQAKKDEENDELTLCFVLIDEASTQLNSRSFKDNIDYDFLNKLLTCRHYHICGIYTTSQRFKLEDKLLRDVTQLVEDCHKVWRFQIIKYYDAWELENAGNPRLIEPIMRKGFFVTDMEYDNYDTYETVEQLHKSCDVNDRLTDEEIMARRYSPDNLGMDGVIAPSRRFKRMKKSMSK